MGASQDDSTTRLQRHEAKVLEAIWAGTHWLSAEEIEVRAPLASTSVLERWEAEGQIFSLERSGRKVYPLYAFDADFRPLAAIEAVLRILGWPGPRAAATFFESTSSFLAGRRPREIVGAQPELVIAKARDDWICEQFGG
jgi:hypothetical protein